MRKAQSTLEFTFAMIAILFLMYGMVQMLRWAGMDLAQRRYMMDSGILNIDSNPANPDYGDPSTQLSFDDNSLQPMSAAWHGSITGNTSP